MNKVQNLANTRHETIDRSCISRPVVLSLSNQGDYEVDMVLATLVEPEPQGVPSSSQISTVVGMWTGTLPEAGDSEEIKNTSQQGDEVYLCSRCDTFYCLI